MKETIKSVLTIIAAGSLIVVGFRIAEWVIPAPDTRVVICFANELDQVEICKPASELLKKRNESKQ